MNAGCVRDAVAGVEPFGGRFLTPTLTPKPIAIEATKSSIMRRNIQNRFFEPSRLFDVSRRRDWFDNFSTPGAKTSGRDQSYTSSGPASNATFGSREIAIHFQSTQLVREPEE